MTARKQRIPFRDFSTLSAEDREMGERNKVNGEVVNIFRVLMQNPKLARSWSRFAGYILGGQSLPARDREILILRIGWLNQAPYEWEQHVRIGKSGGAHRRRDRSHQQRSEGRMGQARGCVDPGGRRFAREVRRFGRDLEAAI